MGLAFYNAAKAAAARRGWARFDISLETYKSTVKGRASKGGYREATVAYVIEGVVSNGAVKPAAEPLWPEMDTRDLGAQVGPQDLS